MEAVVVQRRRVEGGKGKLEETPPSRLSLRLRISHRAISFSLRGWKFRPPNFGGSNGGEVAHWLLVPRPSLYRELHHVGQLISIYRGRFQAENYGQNLNPIESCITWHNSKY
jgi:hypothetical protein